MWKELISDLTDNAQFGPPGSVLHLESIESELGVTLPDELKSLLQESDGVAGEYGLGLIWNIDRIRGDNLRFRQDPDFKSMYMPFDNLLFFADTGTGDQFAYPIRADGTIWRNDIFIWNHENDSRTEVAASLKDYLEGWLSGTLTYY